MILTTATPPPEVPISLFVIAGVGLIGSGFSHWRFRTGWQLLAGRMSPPRELFDLTIRLHFAALPGTVGWAAVFGLFVAFKLAVRYESWPAGAAVLALGAVAVAAFAWSFKEFLHPTLRRSPDWLREVPRIQGTWLPK